MSMIPQFQLISAKSERQDRDGLMGMGGGGGGGGGIFLGGYVMYYL